MMTSLEIFNQFVASNVSFLANLYDRWLDEGVYEPFTEYQQAVMKRMEADGHGIEFVKMHKRPFRIFARLGKMSFIVSVNAKTVSYTYSIG